MSTRVGFRAVIWLRLKRAGLRDWGIWAENVIGWMMCMIVMVCVGWWCGWKQDKDDDVGAGWTQGLQMCGVCHSGVGEGQGEAILASEFLWTSHQWSVVAPLTPCCFFQCLWNGSFGGVLEGLSRAGDYSWCSLCLQYLEERFLSFNSLIRLFIVC